MGGTGPEGSYLRMYTHNRSLSPKDSNLNFLFQRQASYR
jgi:hypothetical protein